MPRSPIGFVLLTRTGNVYVMDEPITGLHPADIDRLPSAFTLSSVLPFAPRFDFTP